MKVFEARTEEGEAPFLSGGWWQPETSVIGVIEREYRSENGPCYVLELEKPVELADGPETMVSIGNLSGFNMCLQALKKKGLGSLEVGDFVEVECIGLKPPKAEGYSPRPNFRVKVTRP